jgi:hypothetical protein
MEARKADSRRPTRSRGQRAKYRGVAKSPRMLRVPEGRQTGERLATADAARYRKKPGNADRCAPVGHALEHDAGF